MKDDEKLETRHIALYRKYRPEEFKDVLGQELALQILENAIEQNKIYHAYIFSGDRGTGKTTVARIFAKAIGSTKDDIFELDAASNNGVDDMRLLIDSVQSSTFGSRYKVYILDEAHMLSKAAFNALLKTLEEPPEHVIFILATTDKQKLPDTIISRCQEINFASPDIKTLEKLITKVSKKEDIEIDLEAKKEIAKEGKGSFRDTLGVLEKILNTTNKKEITLADTENVLGLISENETYNILESICEKDINKLLTSIDNLRLETNQIVERVYLSLVKMFETALYIRILVKDNKKDEVLKNLAGKVGEAQIEKLEELSTKYPKVISSANLYKLLEIEKDLSASQMVKKTVFVIGLIKLIEEQE